MAENFYLVGAQSFYTRHNNENFIKIYFQDSEDGDTTVVSATNDDSNSKTGLDEAGFEVVTIESDYQVSSNKLFRRGKSLSIIFLPQTRIKCSGSLILFFTESFRLLFMLPNQALHTKMQCMYKAT